MAILQNFFVYFKLFDVTWIMTRKVTFMNLNYTQIMRKQCFYNRVVDTRNTLKISSDEIKT